MKHNIVRKVRSYSCVIKYMDNWGDGSKAPLILNRCIKSMSVTLRLRLFITGERDQDNK